MELPVKVIIVAETSSRADYIQNQLSQFPTVKVTAVYGKWKPLPYEDFVRNFEADYFLVDISVADPGFLKIVKFNQHQFPRAQTIFLSRLDVPGFEAMARQTGVYEVFHEPVNFDELVLLLTQPHENEVDEKGKNLVEQINLGPRATTLALISAKDGEGKTTIAVNVASQLAIGHNARVVLIDLNTNFDDFTVMLNQRSQKHFIDMMKLMREGATFEMLEPSFATAEISPHLKYICGPCAIRPIPINFKLLVEFLKMLQHNCDYLVIDTPVFLNEALAAALTTADRYLLVVQNHVASLRNTKAYINSLRKYDYPSKLIRVILNRVSKDVGLTTDDLEKFIGPHPILGRLVSSGKVVIDALNKGVPFVVSDTDTDITRGLEKLVQGITRDRSRAR